MRGPSCTRRGYGAAGRPPPVADTPSTHRPRVRAGIACHHAGTSGIARGYDMADQTVDTVSRAVGVGSLGFGLLATVAPGVLRKAYGDSKSSGGSLDYFSRTWGTRTAVLGALTLMATSDTERRRIATLASAMNAVDSIAGFRAEGMPAVTRTMAGLTSGAFAVAAGYVATNL